MPRIAALFACFLIALTAAQSAVWAAPAQSTTGPPRTIVLPSELAAGERVTLAVLDSMGRLVPAADVQLSDGKNVTTDGTGRAVFVAPAEAGAFTARLTENGLVFSTTVSLAPVNTGAAAPGHAARPGANSPIKFPRTIMLHERFELLGPVFKGDADQNRVVMNNQPALVLAASPRSLIAIPNPNTALGTAKLVVEIAGRAFDPMPVTVVSLEVTGPGKSLAAGEISMLSVRVLGSTEQLRVQIRNFSPDVVEINPRSPESRVQRIATSGGDPNVAKVEMIGVKQGDYSVAVQIVSATVDSPQLESARQSLLAAQHIADAKWKARIETVVRRMDKEPEDKSRIRDEIERLLQDKPQRPVADLLQLAWEDLRYA